MTILNFPTGASTGTVYTGTNSVVYTFDGVKWNGNASTGGSGGGLSISDFGIGFVNTLDAGKITTSKLYNKNPNQGLNNQYVLEVTNGGVVVLPDQSIINGATLKTVAGNYAGITAGPQGADEDSWMWVDNDGATIATKYSTDQFTWKFDNSGTFTLPYGQSIGSGTLDGIKLTTDRGSVLFGNTPECVPTQASHFHIMRDDPTTVDLFFGDDYNYVKLPYYSTLTNIDYGVEVGTNGNNSDYVWRFGTDGLLTLPGGNTVIGNVLGTDGIVGTTGTGVGVVAQGNSGYAGIQWIDDIASLGSTTTQAAGVIVNSPIASTTGTVQILTGVVTGPTAQNVWEFGTDGTLAVPDDIQDVNGSVIRVATTSTAPTRVDGQLWFNSEEGRTYIKYNNQWIDASPAVVPTPDTYLDEITIDGSTINMNGSTLAINTAGVLLVNGSEVTGSGDSINNGPYSVSIDNIGAVTMATGRGTVLFGNIPEGPTGSTHFHIMKDSPSTVDLFFGDDYNYVKLPTEFGVEVGAQGSVWTFSTTGTLTLPEGGIISNGMGAIRLDPAGSSSTQALLIYPTVQDGNHIHLTSGGGDTDLYLGNDDQFVKVDHSGTVVVQTYSTATTSTWTFGTDGVLTLSTASTILGNNSDPNVYIETATVSTTNTWTFAADGTTTFPTGGRITSSGKGGTSLDGGLNGGWTSLTNYYSTGNYAACVTGYSDGTLHITAYNDGGPNPGRDWVFDKTGALTFPDGTTSTGAVITAAQSSSYIIQTLSFSEASPSNFEFSADGRLTVPGDINGHAVYFDIDDSYLYDQIVLQPASSLTTNGFQFITYQNSGTFTEAALELPTADVDKPVTLFFPHQAGSIASIFVQGTNTSNTVFDDAFNIFHNGGNVKIHAEAPDTSFYTWKFGQDGGLTFPNSTVQTTAWTGTVAYSNITNVPSVSTSTLVNGTSTVSLGSTGALTLPDGGTLRMSTAPTSSTGTVGDIAGTIAVNTASIFYCVADYFLDTGTYSVLTTDSNNGSIFFMEIAKGSYPQPQLGWGVSIGGTITQIDGATTDLGTSWRISVEAITPYSTGTSVTLTNPSPSQANIWVKQAWGTTGSW